MNPILRNFYTNINEREAVKAFMIQVLKEMVVDKVFTGETIVGIKEAADCVEKTFDKLEEIYGKIEPSEPRNSR